MNVTTDQLLAQSGALFMENQVLRQKVAELTEQLKQATKTETPKDA